MYYVYVITNKSGDYMYIGHTNNLDRRLKEHNSGKTHSNRAYGPFKLLYKEETPTLEEALSKEKIWKKGYMREKFKHVFKEG